MKTIRKIVVALLMLALAACGTVQAVPTATVVALTQTPVLDPTPAAPPSGDAGGLGVSDAIIEQALAEVSQVTGVPAGDLEVTATETVEWSSSALGCPMPGQAYLDVITPGYRIEVRAGEELFDVGTNIDGTAFAVCPRAGS
jgi:hypothetical protein